MAVEALIGIFGCVCATLTAFGALMGWGEA